MLVCSFSRSLSHYLITVYFELWNFLSYDNKVYTSEVYEKYLISENYIVKRRQIHWTNKLSNK